MDKLMMAHDWAMKYGSCDNFALTVAEAWEYADAMQAAADKRKKEEKDELYEKLADPMKKIKDEKDWQPDWSQAIDDRVNFWSMEANGTATWWIGEPTRNTKEGTHHDNDSCICVDDAPTFNYQGDWKHSLRKRPEKLTSYRSNGLEAAR